MPRLATRRINSSLKSSGSLVVAISSNASINVLGDASTTKYSWGCRAKLTSDNAAATVFFSKASAKYALQLRIESGGKVRASIYDGVNNPVAQSANTYTDNEWHTFIGVRDGTSLKLYIDGSLAGSTTSTINDCNESSNISMFGNGTKGVFSEGFVTLTAMTATEVMNHEINNTLPVSCLAILPCNEGAGSIAYDTSGNANNGTITSPTWTRDTPSKTRKAVNGNLVFNGDFEIAPVVNVATTTPARWIDGTAGGSTTNNIFGWYFSSTTGTTSTQFDTATTNNGAASLKLSATATSTAIVVTSTQRLSGVLAYGYEALPSTSYTASVWIKTALVSGSATTGVGFKFIERSGAVSTVTTSYVATNIVTTTGWTRYSATFTTNAATRFLLPACEIVGNDGTATLIMDAWFDDITLVKSQAQTRKSFNDNILPNGFVDKLPSSIVAQSTGGTFMDGTAAGSATNTAYNWFLYTYSGTWSAIFDTSTKYSGLASLKLSTNAGSIGVSMNAFTASDISWSRNNIPCEPNTTYKLSVKIKTELISGSATTGASAFVSHRTIDNGSAGIDTILATGIITTTDWTEYTAFMTTGPTVRFLNPAFRIVGNNGAATLNMNAWMDEFTITPQVISRKTPDNLLSNGNFEYAPPFTAAQTTGFRWLDGTATGSSSRTAYNIYFINKSGSASIRIDNTEKYNGNNSLKISNLAVASFVEAALTDGVSVNISILPSTSYTYSYWMKTNYVSGDASNGIGVRFLQNNGAGTGIITTISGDIKTTTDWTYYTGTITTNVNARFMRVKPALDGSTGAGTLIMDAWFDDITLTKVPADARTIVS
jgi:hypothetical protein